MSSRISRRNISLPRESRAPVSLSKRPSDADNQQVKLSMPELEELAAAMVQAQVDRNDEIYRRQREMKEELSGLEDLGTIRAFDVT
nr:DUF4376 domain-containing protein [Shigella sonnei]